MADNSKIAFSGGAGAAIGVALGLLFGGPDVSGIEDKVSTAGTEVTALSTQLTELGDRMSALEETAASAAATPQLTSEDLGAAIDGLSGDLNSRMDALADSIADASTQSEGANQAQIDAIVAALDARHEERMEEFRERMATRRKQHQDQHNAHHGKRPENAESGEDPALEMDEDSAAAAATTLPAPEVTAPAPTRILTETIVLADGKVRAYVAGYLADEDIARVAINGFTVSEIRKGRSAEVEVGEETCSVTFTGVEENRVQLEANCE